MTRTKVIWTATISTILFFFLLIFKRSFGVHLITGVVVFWAVQYLFLCWIYTIRPLPSKQKWQPVK